MKKIFLRLNVLFYLAITAFLGMAVVTSLSSGHPWAIACYNCRLCSSTCPLGFDPYGFVTAAISNDPDLYMNAVNVRLRLGEALDLDENMLISHQGGEITARQVLAQGVDRDREVTVSKMKARHAAKYCPLCRNCEKPCPIELPIMKIIEDLKEDGKFKN